MLDQQQILDIRLNESVSLENFVIGDNQQLLSSLREIAEVPNKNIVYAWGESGVGKTHLLHGTCHLAAQFGKTIAYLPMGLAGINLQALGSLEQVSLVCVDDVHLIAGKPEWEQALFHLYNAIKEQGHSLLLSANVSIPNLKIELPDLRSRLAWGLVYQVRGLSDANKVVALKQKANSRGFELPDNVAQYLINHCPRDSHSLFSIIDKLDLASLAAQRKITIPFLKKML